MLYAGAKIAPTGAPTVFRFETHLRRGAYKAQDTRERERGLNAMRTGTFVRSELIEIVHCAHDDRLIRVEASADRAQDDR